ncbi:MAG: ATP-binding protein [Bacteroidota bacterium]
MASVEGILILAEGGLISFANKIAGELFQFSPENQGLSILEVIPDFLKPDVQTFLEGAQETYKQEISLEEGERFVNFSLNRIQRAGVEVLAILEDISERKKAEANLSRNTQKLTRANKHLENTLTALKNTQVNLIQAEKMSSLGQLTAGIAHELNNPINFMFAGIQALQANFDDLLEFMTMALELSKTMPTKEVVVYLTEKYKELEVPFLLEDTATLLKDVEEGADRTANIVKGLLTFSRMNEDHYQAVNLHDSINSTLTILRGQFRGRIKVERNFGDTPLIEGLAGKINQVLMNLLVNAGDAIKGEGKITITTRNVNLKDIPAVQLSVQDTGVGIPEDIKNKIFDPFFTTKDVGKGTGLGLYITLGIVERHHGTVQIDSVAGEGTTFHITFPVHQDSH